MLAGYPVSNNVQYGLTQATSCDTLDSVGQMGLLVWPYCLGHVREDELPSYTVGWVKTRFTENRDMHRQ